jgi:hypothetical protein
MNIYYNIDIQIDINFFINNLVFRGTLNDLAFHKILENDL